MHPVPDVASHIADMNTIDFSPPRKHASLGSIVQHFTEPLGGEVKGEDAQRHHGAALRPLGFGFTDFALRKGAMLGTGGSLLDRLGFLLSFSYMNSTWASPNSRSSMSTAKRFF